RYGLAEVVFFSLLFLTFVVLFGVAGLLWHWSLWLPALPVVGLWAFVVSFFRDPHRNIPADAAALVSPADGTVTHIEEVTDHEFPQVRALRISIFLSVFSVHINRVPRAGRVTAVRYFPGAFLDARTADCAVRNEQLWVDLEEAGTARMIRVKQISGAIARRIVCWLKLGDLLQKGERFGMIKFGSRTDLLIAAHEAIDVRVKVGEQVYGGSTVLLRFSERHA